MHGRSVEIEEIVFAMVGSSPMFLVYLFGMVLCIRNWTFHPKKSLFIGGGIAITFLIGILFALLGSSLLSYFTRELGSTTFVVFLYSMLHTLPQAAGLLLIFWGAFMITDVQDADSAEDDRFE